MSSNPNLLPAYEKLWQGEPPDNKSSSPFFMLNNFSKSNLETFAISSLITFQLGRFTFKVLDASLSNSTNTKLENPAFSKPIASQPAPANS